MATSVFDHKVYLAGASGGCYALVTAHVATLILNWHEDKVILKHRFSLRFSNKEDTNVVFHGQLVRWLRLISVITYAVIDIGLALYNRYHLQPDGKPNKVSYVAHLSGAIGGILVGIIILKNRKVESWETKLKILCMVTFGFFVGGCIFWNVAADYIMPTTKYFENSEDKTKISSRFYFPSQDFQNYTECSNPSL
jgi:rhomboid-related protein 1/2/3